jgi:hypothetical protein
VLFLVSEIPSGDWLPWSPVLHSSRPPRTTISGKSIMLQPHQKLSRKRRWVRYVLGNMGLLFTSYSEKRVVFGLWDFFSGDCRSVLYDCWVFKPFLVEYHICSSRWVDSPTTTTPEPYLRVLPSPVRPHDRRHTTRFLFWEKCSRSMRQLGWSRVYLLPTLPKFHSSRPVHNRTTGRCEA